MEGGKHRDLAVWNLFELESNIYLWLEVGLGVRRRFFLKMNELGKD